MRVLPLQRNQGHIPLAPSKRGEEEEEGSGSGSGSGAGRGCIKWILWCGSSSSSSSGVTGVRRGGAAVIKVEAVHPSSNFQQGAQVGDGAPMGPPACGTVPLPAACHAANGDDAAPGGVGGVLKVCLKSSLRKPCGPGGAAAGGGRRNVQWNDAHGQELVQVKEFERSESSGSDDEDDGGASHGCACVIQ